MENLEIKLCEKPFDINKYKYQFEVHKFLTQKPLDKAIELFDNLTNMERVIVMDKHCPKCGELKEICKH